MMNFVSLIAVCLCDLAISVLLRILSSPVHPCLIIFNIENPRLGKKHLMIDQILVPDLYYAVTMTSPLQ